MGGFCALIGGSKAEAIATDAAGSDGQGTGTTRNYSGIDIGPAASDRIVVVLVKSQIAGDVRQLSSATINGVSATIAASHSGARPMAVFYLAVPTGTTCSIQTVWNGNVGSDDLVVYTITGQDVSTPVDADTVQSGGAPGSASITLTTSDDGVAIFCIYTVSDTLASPIVTDGSFQQSAGGAFFITYGQRETPAGSVTANQSAVYAMAGISWV